MAIDLQDIERLTNDVIARHRSSKWGRPDYTSTISSQDLRKLTEALLAMLPVAKAATEWADSECDRTSSHELYAAVEDMDGKQRIE
jgi:hypothetical protein